MSIPSGAGEGQSPSWRGEPITALCKPGPGLREPGASLQREEEQGAHQGGRAQPADPCLTPRAWDMQRGGWQHLPREPGWVGVPVSSLDRVAVGGQTHSSPPYTPQTAYPSSQRPTQHSSQLYVKPQRKTQRQVTAEGPGEQNSNLPGFVEEPDGSDVCAGLQRAHLTEQQQKPPVTKEPTAAR